MVRHRPSDHTDDDEAEDDEAEDSDCVALAAYKVLCLSVTEVMQSKNEDDAVAQIEKAWRRLLLVHHPDKNGGTRESTERAKRLNSAKDACIGYVHRHYMQDKSSRNDRQGRGKRRPKTRTSSRAATPPEEEDRRASVRASIAKMASRQAATEERVRREKKRRAGTNSSQ